jgi:hypothetical protein
MFQQGYLKVTSVRQQGTCQGSSVSMLGFLKANIIDTKKVGRDMFVYWSGLGRVQVTKIITILKAKNFSPF